MLEIGNRRLLHEVKDQKDADLEAPFGRHIALDFDAFGSHHHVVLSLNDALFEEGAVSRYTDDQGMEISELPTAVAYTGTFPDGGWIRAVIHEDDVIQAMWLDNTNGQVNMLTPIHYSDMASSTASGGGKMIAHRLHEVEHDHHDRALLESWLGKDFMNTTKCVRGRNLQQMSSILKTWVPNTSSPYGLMQNCPSTMRRAGIGIAMDAGYTKALTGLGQTSITNRDAVRKAKIDIQFQMSILNLLYVDMANVFLAVAETLVKTKSGGEDWNEEPLRPDILRGDNRWDHGCPTSRSMKTDQDYNTVLLRFDNWRRGLPVRRRHVTWHLMTNCYPVPGVVGMAYLGTTCNHAFNTGWNNIGHSSQPYGTFLTLAHEIGHTFGAQHTFDDGGIMSYESPNTKEFKFTGKNPSEICSHVNAKMNACYGVMRPRCGNGILEPGEECDDRTACCDRTTCKLKAGAMCTPGTDSSCCTAACKFQPTYTGCTSAATPGQLYKKEALGYCANGVCNTNKLAARLYDFNGKGCNAPQNDACKEYAKKEGGQCLIDTGHKLKDYNMPDGAFCNAALNKVCQNGRCVTPSLVVDEEQLPGNVRRRAMQVPQTVDLLNPLKDEVLYIGTIAVIRWNVEGHDADIVTLTLSDGTVLLDKGKVEKSQFLWNVQATPGTNFTVTILAHPANGSDTRVGKSDVFTIQEQPELALITPVEDAVVFKGEVTIIKWVIIGNAGLSDVDIFIVDEETDDIVVSLGSHPNTGQFTWVPSSSLPAIRVRVMLEYSPPTDDHVTIHSAPFDLHEPISDNAMTFVSPSDGDILEQGVPYRITWTSPATLVNTNLYLTQPWTDFRQLIMKNVDENAFDWTPELSGTGFQLELYDQTADGKIIMNATSSAFSISAPRPFVKITDIFEGQNGAVWARGRNASVFVKASDPSDTVTLDIRDARGARIYVVATDAHVSQQLSIPIAYTVPPPDFYAGFLTATSNTYPGVSHTFPTPFSLTNGDEFDDLPHVPPSLTMTHPPKNFVLIPGSKVNITWDGVHVSNVAIHISNKTSSPDNNTTTLLATVTNTGVYEWTVPLTLAEYTLSLVGDGRIVSPPINVSVSTDMTKTNTPTIALVDDVPTLVSEGDTVNIAYHSSGVVTPVSISLWTKALGRVAEITNNAPTNGSYHVHFAVRENSHDIQHDAFLVLSTASGARAQSSLFTIYPKQYITNVSIDATTTTLYKGKSYNVTWTSTGIPFPVAILLYRGIPDERQTASGEKCIAWKDHGVTTHGCILSFDLTSEMCATKVDANQRWLLGGRCKPLSETFTLISVMTTGHSTDHKAQIEIPASSTALPLPASDYTIVVASTSTLQMEAHSTLLSIQHPIVELVFPIQQQNAATPLGQIRESILDVLASVLKVEPKRLIVDVIKNQGVQDIVRAHIQPTNSLASHAAFEAAKLFVNEWTDPKSPLNKAVQNSTLFTIDQTGKQPAISFVEDDNPMTSRYSRRRLKPLHVASITIGIIATIGLSIYNIRRIIR